MNTWSLPKLLANLHDDIERRLAIVRESVGHSTAKGDASESIWLELLQRYLPKRYQSERAHVVDSRGDFSQQIDVVVFDRHYSPFIFDYEGQKVVPAESVYAIFEAKQTIGADEVRYTRAKLESVRTLYRTSLPIPHAGGTYPPKPLASLLGGLLSLESAWSPPLGQPLIDALESASNGQQLDLGCVAAHGAFWTAQNGHCVVTAGGKPATAFLFELIARLQSMATVPMIDVRAYAKWLSP